MARRLSAQDRVLRLRDAGYTNAQIGKAIGRSPSTVSKIASGRSSGAKALPALREFAGRGKRTREAIVRGERKLERALPPSPARKAPPKKSETRITPIQRAEGQLAMLDKGGVDKVVVHITSKESGRSRTLFSKGGVSLADLRDDLAGALSGQAARQGYGGEWDFDSYDYTIDFEEY